MYLCFFLSTEMRLLIRKIGGTAALKARLPEVRAAMRKYRQQWGQWPHIVVAIRLVFH